MVKELTALAETDVLQVMVKDTDWMPGSILVDGALQAVGLTRGQLPARLFYPMIVAETGVTSTSARTRCARTGSYRARSAIRPDHQPVRDHQQRLTGPDTEAPAVAGLCRA
jgi:hypothetical protein